MDAIRGGEALVSDILLAARIFLELNLVLAVFCMDGQRTRELLEASDQRHQGINACNFQINRYIHKEIYFDLDALS